MAEVNCQLEAQQLILKHGTIIDATVVQAAVNPPSGPKGTVAPGTKAPEDPDAEWSTRKDGSVRHYHFGYKAHVAVDAGSGLVRKAILTGAKTNETVVADDLICGDEQCVYGDKAYDSVARRELLARLGIADGIMRRAWWGTARNPDPELVARNRSLDPHPLRGRAQLRLDEALVRLSTGALPRLGAQWVAASLDVYRAQSAPGARPARRVSAARSRTASASRKTLS